MFDLVKQLRITGAPRGGDGLGGIPICNEAADEIEQSHIIIRKMFAIQNQNKLPSEYLLESERRFLNHVLNPDRG